MSRNEKAQQKREYARQLLQADHTIADGVLKGLVHSKFGSGISGAEINEARLALGWKWDRQGRGRKLIPAEKPTHQAVTEAGEKVTANPPPAGHQETERKLREFVTSDDELEVKLIKALQEVMRRQGYEMIEIPKDGEASITYPTIGKKKPGEHVAGLGVAHHH